MNVVIEPSRSHRGKTTVIKTHPEFYSYPVFSLGAFEGSSPLPRLKDLTCSLQRLPPLEWLGFQRCSFRYGPAPSTVQPATSLGASAKPHFMPPDHMQTSCRPFFQRIQGWPSICSSPTSFQPVACSLYGLTVLNTCIAVDRLVHAGLVFNRVMVYVLMAMCSIVAESSGKGGQNGSA